MKAKDLRVGNFLTSTTSLLNGVTLVVSDINETHVQAWGLEQKYSQYGASDKFLIPIPLTEEWLLKFGFEKSKKNFSLGVHQELFSGVMIFSFDRYLQKWVFSIGSYKDLTRVQYVHQLQNLYFALTGEELELK